ncbi:OmpA family protein [Runella aurantiaca]|uniref:OmpA family protein n=1 Tax=Runella aurantiaca TaxID=2282308 RepID=UPI001E52EEF4|nr:OmpA family protein [Runella aurantiaca]
MKKSHNERLFWTRLMQSSAVRNRSIFFFSLLISSSLFAQSPQSFLPNPSGNKKAIEAFERSTKFFIEKNYEQANRWTDETLKYDSTFAEAHFRKAHLYEIYTQPDLALQSYRKVVTLRPDAPQSAAAYQKLIEYHLRAGEYAQAKNDLTHYIPLLRPNSVAQKRAQRQLLTCAFGEKAIENPLVISPEELSDTVNQFILQYFPALTADGETLLFTALRPENDEDLYITHFKDGHWTSPVSISDKINTAENEGTGTLSADGRTLVFTACNRRDGYGSCDLYISRKNGKDWEAPKNIGINVNTPFWESQPTLSPDGRTLYFISDRKGGIGGRDVWYTSLQKNGEWSAAKNIGGPVNTPDDEASPYLHANGHTLFFASEGHQGFGGYDLFFSDSTATGWQKPENLGYPINTSDNQVALVITSDSQYGYYSLDTKRVGNQRVSRLYRFRLPTELQQKFNAANYLKGLVTDARSGKSVKANLELIDLKTGKVVQRFSTDTENGQYLTTLPNGSEWGLYVNAAGYFYKSLSFDYTQKNKAEGLQLDIKLEPMNLNTFGVLSNIYFETGKADLQDKSRTELNKLIEELKLQSTLRIEIAGHTDDVGDPKQNQILSQKRAQSVADYLITAGISRERIRAIGFGEAKPMAPNTSEENRQLNRRIEWRIW